MNIDKMTPEEKVGNLFTISIAGHDVNGDIINLLNTYHVGGIYLAEENVKHPKQVNQLSYRLQNFTTNKQPLFIMMKQNGSELNTLKKQVTPGLTGQEIGHLHNRVYTKRMASYVAKELYGMGINMNLGPMLHASENDASSYSANIDLVAKQGRAAIEGYQSEQILAAAGLFPTDRETLNTDTPFYKTAIHPFLYAIKHGAKAIATKDGRNAAPFLRDIFDFEGLILQDNTDTVTNNQQVIEAIQAGTNMILLKDTYKAQMETIEAVINALKAGDISETIMNQSLERIANLKEQFTVNEMAPFNRDLFAGPKSMAFMKQMNNKLTSK